MNQIIAEKVEELLDASGGANYGPEVGRFYSREQAAAIIHAALLGYGARAGSTAGAYAAANLFDTIGLKFWCFDKDEAEACSALCMKLRHERGSGGAGSPRA
jgi:hypothetical protein